MKNKEFDLMYRVAPGIVVEKTIYTRGLLDIVEFLFSELKNLLKQENRFFGIVKSYVHSISKVYEELHKLDTSELCDMYGRILYLFKPIIIREFERLIDKNKLSPADSCIVIMHRILAILVESGQEVGGIQKIINKMFDYIKTKGKNDKLFSLSLTLKNYMERGMVGKHIVDTLNLKVEKVEKGILENGGSRLSIGKDMEIEL